MWLRVWMSLIFASLVLPSLASDTAALKARVDAYSAAMKSKSYEGIVDVVPLRVLEMMAERANTDPATLRSAMIQQTEQAIATIDILELSIDAVSPDYQTTETGIVYAFLPTEALMAIPGVGKVESETSTLALQESGMWFLAAIDQPQQVLVIREAYPGFKSVDFPTGVTRPAE